ncbi:hypothetical protein F8388_012208 [Cannabis sativa]|uniref:RNase H type-1 domain-containing protein n=1 Tax=Cannabis sativa TaxID=3483 RepID=A0A7J6EVS9_CANSA|nr:hypothetical protein F8388_012208 [Cannabis sativa]
MHTWYHPYPTISNFQLPTCPSNDEKVTEIGAAGEVANSELNFYIGVGKASQSTRKRGQGRKIKGKDKLASTTKKMSGVKTRRGRRREEISKADCKDLTYDLEVVLANCVEIPISYEQNFGNGEEAASFMPPPPVIERTLWGLIRESNADVAFLSETTVGMEVMSTIMNCLGFANVVGLPVVASYRNATSLMELLRQYEGWSYQKVNMVKSRVVFSPNMPCKEDETLKDVETVCFQTDASMMHKVAGMAIVETRDMAATELWAATDFAPVSSALEGELLAILMALRKARERNISKLHIQSNALVAVDALNSGYHPFDNVFFIHISRYVNGIADALAVWARCAKVNAEGPL